MLQSKHQTRRGIAAILGGALAAHATAARAASDAPAAPDPPAREAAKRDDGGEAALGPVEWEAGPGFVGLGVAAQLQSAVQSVEDADGRREELALSIRRLRTTLRGGFFEDRYQFEFQLNTTAETFELVDVWIGFAFSEDVQLRAGQMKVPYTWYRQLSFSTLALVDWSPTTAWFGSERQLGAMVHDDASAEGRWSYRLGVFSGENRRASHAIRLPEYYGEPVRNPSAADGIGAVREVDPELVGTIRYASRGFEGGAQTDVRGGPARWALAASSAVNFDADPTRDFAARGALEGWLKLHHLSLMATGYVAFAREARSDAIFAAASGANFEAAYRFSRAFEVAGRLALIAPTPSLANDARSRADARIEDAESPGERDRLAAQYAQVGAITREQEARLGATYFIVGHGLKLQADVGWIRREQSEGSLDDVQARALIQLAF